MPIRKILNPEIPIQPDEPFLFAIQLYSPETLPFRGFAFLWPRGIPAEWLAGAQAAAPDAPLGEILDHALLGPQVLKGLQRTLRDRMSSLTDELVIPSAGMHPAPEAQCFTAAIRIGTEDYQPFVQAQALISEFLLASSSAIFGDPIILSDALMTWGNENIPPALLSRIEQPLLSESANAESPAGGRRAGL